MTKHINETIGTKYKLFVNGKLTNTTSVYDFAMNRGLGVAMYLKLQFVNTSGSNMIMDKWSDNDNMVLITKHTSN